MKLSPPSASELSSQLAATQIVTFYSYKGGVGRTMALANAACQLANKHGLDVIVVDWDLEAPGLHYYFGLTDADLTEKRGLIDYLEDFVGQVRRGTEGKIPNLNEYLLQPAPEISSKLKWGSVRLMSCGRTDHNYMARVRSFDWEAFYGVQHGFEIVETLKQQLRSAAQITLVDARSGQSDIGATPTIQVPDAVILLFSSNHQNLDGTARVARFLKRHPMREQQHFPDLRILLVPSRVFPREDAYRHWIASEAESVYLQLIKEGVVNRDDQPRGLYQCVLVTDPHATVGETLPVLDPENSPSDLRSAYEELAAAIADLHAGTEVWSSRRPIEAVRPDTHGRTDGQSPESEVAGHEELSASIGSTRPQSDMAAPADYKALAEAIERNDDHQAARLQLQLGIAELEDENYDQAETLFRESLSYYERKNETARIVLLFLWLARLYERKNQLDRAWYTLDQALRLSEELKDDHLRASVLQGMGEVRRSQRRLGEALELFGKALALQEQANNLRAQRDILTEMARTKRDLKEYDGAFSLGESALSRSEKIGDVQGQSRTLHMLAHFKWDRKHYDEARELFERALKVLESNSDLYGQNQNLRCLANIQRELGNFDHAWELFQQALAVSEKLGDARDQSHTLYAMAQFRSEQRRSRDAFEIYGRMVSLGERSGDFLLQVESLHAMAHFLKDEKRLDEAWTFLERALAVAERSGRKHKQSLTLFEMAAISAKRGKHEQEWDLLSRALTLAEQSGDFVGQSALVHAMGHVKEQQGKLDEAAELFERSLATAEKAADFRRQLENWVCLAGIRKSQAKLDEAASLLDRAVEVAEATDNLRAKRSALYHLALLRRDQDRPQAAYQLFQRCLELDAALNDIRRQSIDLLQMGDLRRNENHLEDASELYTRSLGLAEQINDRRGQIISLTRLAETAERQEMKSQGRHLRKRARKLADPVEDADLLRSVSKN